MAFPKSDEKDTTISGERKAEEKKSSASSLSASLAATGSSEGDCCGNRDESKGKVEEDSKGSSCDSFASTSACSTLFTAGNLNSLITSSSCSATTATASSSSNLKSEGSKVKTDHGKTGGKQEEEENLYPEEEVTEGDWQTPQVDISLVTVDTGEEDEEVFWQHRSKLFRWNAEQSEWKERGIGESRLLRHKKSGKIRFLLRQEKTLKVVANHYVRRSHVYCKLTPNVASEKIWVWTVPDSADDGSPKVEQFGLKFAQLEPAKVFKTKFDEAAHINAKLFPEVVTEEKKTGKNGGIE